MQYTWYWLSDPSFPPSLPYSLSLSVCARACARDHRHPSPLMDAGIELARQIAVCTLLFWPHDGIPHLVIDGRASAPCVRVTEALLPTPDVHYHGLLSKS